MGSGQLLPGVFQQQTPLQIRGLLFGSLNLGQQPAPPPPASSWTRMIPSGNAIMAIIAVVILFVAMMWWMDFALK
ncbi:hypothetical protein CO172_00040 [Candidatus Uhrbacteria bacterium CG_4_9_14_3_um_filter_36_7]|uniref:Uncharacterized protein n=1 Tax=Candidatus Uhrbacteria bacterium CG_4_9_14_3_um_filter_36_7 TaxID=1975033 RepID=A0A2M7XIK9_9BACT|nr:MAG: hypothetical protein CO172_00040 [Candidatus Uhrbacteria bacterium CG_4_9_14_3_um_filter_36_7]